MGAYRFIRPYLRRIFGREPAYVGREPASSPATGSMRVHREQQIRLVERALGMGHV